MMPSVKKHVVPPGLMNTKIVSKFPTFIFIFLLHYLDVEGKFVTGVQLTVFTAAGVLFVLGLLLFSPGLLSLYMIFLGVRRTVLQLVICASAQTLSKLPYPPPFSWTPMRHFLLSPSYTCLCTRLESLAGSQ